MTRRLTASEIPPGRYEREAMTTEAPTPVRTDRFTAEWDPEAEHWLVLWPDRTVTAYTEADEVRRVVEGWAARMVAKTGGMLATAIVWQNVPDGFEPPEGAE